MPSIHDFMTWEPLLAATAAVVTPLDAAVQGLVGSPGWIAFGDNGGGDRIAVDLTPGPRGHVGQLIVLDHEQNIGAALLAESLTDLVVNRRSGWHSDRRGDQPPAVVNIRSLTSLQAAAHPELEVLSIGVWDGEPLSLAPVTADHGHRQRTPRSLGPPSDHPDHHRGSPRSRRVVCDDNQRSRRLARMAAGLGRRHHGLAPRPRGQHSTADGRGQKLLIVTR
ncbi:hypothetical protein [Nonomuraea sp. NPDC049158]|uniref:hypothetical protein n=1 Tax=Nonomuraea sp. NPDC049158 TaxID=3155649 RepID=UPI0033BFEF14